MLAAAPAASAQSLALRIEKGLVTIDATNVTVDEILARWTAATGLNVVSKSGVGSDVPVTVRLSGVSEREALQTVLRDMSGYIMGERRDPLTGLVTIDRLLILPQSGAQATASTVPRVAPGGRRNPFVRGTPTPPAVAETFVAPPAESETPVELAPAPGRSGSAGPGRLIGSGPGAVLDLTGAGEPNVDPSLETAPPAPAAAPSPFGNSRGASRPGEMTPPPPADVQPQVIRSRSSEGQPGPQTTPPPPAPEP